MQRHSQRTARTPAIGTTATSNKDMHSKCQAIALQSPTQPASPTVLTPILQMAEQLIRTSVGRVVGRAATW